MVKCFSLELLSCKTTGRVQVNVEICCMGMTKRVRRFEDVCMGGSHQAIKAEKGKRGCKKKEGSEKVVNQQEEVISL